MSGTDGSVRLVVAIVTWRAAKLTIQCLEALRDEIRAHPDVRAVVVDNDSQDGTADTIAAAIEAGGWGDWAELVRAPRNGGFAYGNNLVFRLAQQRYPAWQGVLLLNPDTVIRPGALAAMRDFLAARPDVGIVGGRCEDPDGTPQICAFRFPGVVSEFAAQLRFGPFDRVFRRHLVGLAPVDRPIDVGWVAGALMLVRREVVDAIGLMDESYFLYYEETDYSLRARRAGWPTWHVPAARTIHFVGQVTGVQQDNPRPRRLPAYWYESRRRYFVLNHGLARARAVDLAVTLGQWLWQLRRAIERKPAVDPPHWLRDLWRLGAWGRGRRGLPPRQTA